MDDETLRVLKHASPGDFDGHTGFSEMTPGQRLTWLDEANAACMELHGRAAPELLVAERPVGYRTKGE